MQHFYCEVCKVTEAVDNSASMIYHRHDTVLTMLNAVPERMADKLDTKVSKKTIISEAEREMASKIRKGRVK